MAAVPYSVVPDVFGWKLDRLMQSSRIHQSKKHADGVNDRVTWKSPSPVGASTVAWMS